MPSKTYNDKDLIFNIVFNNNVVRILCKDNTACKLYEKYIDEKYIIDEMHFIKVSNDIVYYLTIIYDTICKSFENKEITITAIQNKIELSMNIDIPTLTNIDISPLIVRINISLFLRNVNKMMKCIMKLEKRIQYLEKSSFVPFYTYNQNYYTYYANIHINKLCISITDPSLLYNDNTLCVVSWGGDEVYITVDYIINNRPEIIGYFNKFFKMIKVNNIVFTGRIKEFTEEQKTYLPKLVKDDDN